MIDADQAISHTKVMMIDGEIVIMGSFNLTTAAQEKNVENVLIIRGPPWRPGDAARGRPPAASLPLYGAGVRRRYLLGRRVGQLFQSVMNLRYWPELLGRPPVYPHHGRI